MKINELGQSLIEVLIALAASVAVVSAIAVTVITSLSNAEFTKNQNLSTQYSREGMEIIRQIAKNNWTDFLKYTNINYCLDKGSVLPRPKAGQTCGKNIDNIFDRQLTIDPNSPRCISSIEITSTVLWTDSKCQTGDILCHQIKLRTCLADINSVKGP